MKNAWALAAMIAGGVAPFAGADVYTFNTLPVGPVMSHDHWKATDEVVIAVGSGTDATRVLSSSRAATGFASRVNGDGFSFPVLTHAMSDVTLGFDFRVIDPARLSLASLRLAQSGRLYEAYEEQIGVAFYSGFRHLLVHRADGTTLAGGPNNFEFYPGDWYRIELRIDFTADEGNGRWSAFYQDLTRGDSDFSPVRFLQDLRMDLAADVGWIDPSRWNRMDVEVANAQVDNIVVRVAAEIPPTCRADWNHDRDLNSQDIFDFLTDFFTHSADFNQDGKTTSQDLFDMLTAFFAGC